MFEALLSVDDLLFYLDVVGSRMFDLFGSGILCSCCLDKVYML